MRCIDTRWRARGTLLLAAGLGACSAPPPPPVPAPVVTAKPRVVEPSEPPIARPPAAVLAYARNWTEYRLRAARRIVDANPAGTYLGTPQEMLLAIPVLEIELNADGSVRRIHVLRQPSEATEATQIAIDAVRRSAPFGDVSRLPKPWKFVETFLFNDDHRFKPRSLDD